MGGTADYKRFIKSNLASIFSFINLGFIQGSNALIQFLLIPIIFRIVGIGEFGHIGLATAFAGVAGLVVNYGSNQSGIKEVALKKSDTQQLSNAFYTIFVTRIVLFFVALMVLLVIHQYGWLQYGRYFLFAMAIVLAETLNPYFFFVGVQKLLVYNITNLVIKSVSVVLIILLVTSPSEGEWVNFYIGLPGVIGYAGLCFYVIRKYKIGFPQLATLRIREYLLANFYLAANALSVQLQQSIFLFSISSIGDAVLLGAYSLCDKIVWAFRLLLVAFANAVYPKATQVYHFDKKRWSVFRKKINVFLFIIFSLAAVLLFVLSPMIVLIVTGANNALAIGFIKAICLVPLVSALNSLNVIDLLIKNKYDYIFIIALVLLALSAILSQFFIHLKDISLFGFYPIIIETCSLPLYLYFIRKTDR